MESAAFVEKELQNLKFDGSVDIQVVCRVKCSRKDTKEHTIFAKARIANGAGVKEGGMKHLYIDQEGKVCFNINSYGQLHGRTKINDG